MSSNSKHNSGKLKQSNKKHKNHGSTRPSTENSLNGRVNKHAALLNKNKVEGKLDRLNRQKQLNQDKRSKKMTEMRKFASKITCIVGVINLLPNLHPERFIQLLIDSNPQEWVPSTTIPSMLPARFDLYNNKHARSFTFLFANIHDPIQILNVVNISDHLLFYSEASDDLPLISQEGNDVLTLLASSGAPSATCVITSNTMNFQLKNPNKQWKTSIEQLKVQLSNVLSTEIKFLDISDAHWINRCIDSINKPMKWKTQRSYVLSDQITLVTNENNQEIQDNSSCSIRLQGVLRGVPLHINSLMHIPGIGAGKIVRIRKLGVGSTGGESVTIDANPELQDKLHELQAIPDTLMGEQTWPDEEEEAMMMHDNTNDQETNHPDDDEDDNEEDIDPLEGIEQLPTEKKPAPQVYAIQNNNNNPDQIPEEEEDYFDLQPGGPSGRARLARYRALQSFRHSYWHPKENLPEQYSRIYQFQDMKGMQKRNSEQIEKLIVSQTTMHLPHQQKKNNKKQQNNSKQQNDMEIDCIDGEDQVEEEGGMMMEGEDNDSNFLLQSEYIQTDQYIDIELSFEQISTQKIQEYLQSKAPYLIAYNLYTHEHKVSILNYKIRTLAADLSPVLEELYKLGKIKSKDSLLFHVGFRSFWSRPIFSESNLNCDKHKFLKFLPLEGYNAATCIGPVWMTTLTPPVLIFKQVPDITNNNQPKLQLVASGSLFSVDPDRITLKKVILTGNPLRVRKRTAVIRHMFYEPQDTKWFKPAELVTMHGLRGHIKESVGTHGLFKAIFSAPIKQNDMVMLMLYKRVFPKFVQESSEPFEIL